MEYTIAIQNPSPKSDEDATHPPLLWIAFARDGSIDAF